jgi:hypothetical protein
MELYAEVVSTSTTDALRRLGEQFDSGDVAILVAAGCNVREVSEWAGHNSVAFTLTRYGGLFEDGSDAAVDRLDALFSGGDESGGVVQLRRR